MLPGADGSDRPVLSEWMDEPCSYADLRGCLVDLARVNRITLAHRPTLTWLRQVIRLLRPAGPVRIVDIGCGGGDMLRHIETWAARRNLEVRLTGLDSNPLAIRAAREFTPASSRIWWVVGEAERLSEPADIIISSLLTHHLPDDAIPPYFAWMERTARLGWFVNDLRRSRISSTGFFLLAHILRLHSFVRHDGVISIRRAFLPDDWKRYFAAANVSPDQVRVFRCWPARLCVARLRLP